MNHFSNLGLADNASEDSIKKAYRQLAKKYHPDLNPSPNAESKFVSINQSYEWLLNDRYKLKTTAYYYPNTNESKSNTPFQPANEYDLDGDGKLSAEEWKKMKNSKLEEAARAFYNLHQTSQEYRIWVGSYYASIIFFLALDIFLWILAYKTGGSGAFIASGFICAPFFIGLLMYFFTSDIATEHRSYIKIIRRKYDATFKILGVFEF